MTLIPDYLIPNHPIPELFLVVPPLIVSKGNKMFGAIRTMEISLPPPNGRGDKWEAFNLQPVNFNRNNGYNQAVRFLPIRNL
jgi:hypothetical protein